VARDGGIGSTNQCNPDRQQRSFSGKPCNSSTYVISTKIDKSTEDRSHFFLAYGTKDRRDLKHSVKPNMTRYASTQKTAQTPRNASV
jgi:hypothetical protein